jgi:hypothetical protein
MSNNVRARLRTSRTGRSHTPPISRSKAKKAKAKQNPKPKPKLEANMRVKIFVVGSSLAAQGWMMIDISWRHQTTQKQKKEVTD